MDPDSMPDSSTLKVLMKNRENALSNPGGDTVVMVRTTQELRKAGIQVDIDLEGNENLADYDMVHLHNFATPQHTEKLARECVAAGVPCVVTTMYEDAPLFYSQMTVQAEALIAYVESGQSSEEFRRRIKAVKACKPAPRLENSWTAGHADALIASGKREKETLQRDYPDAKHVVTYRLGSDLGFPDIDGAHFESGTGLRDFILCVGRVESRKNQLMLLKALEDSELTVVFATGGFTYQPAYAKACTLFRRKGKTVFLNRLSEKDLASAYAAARVHALPSWYELPGIVSQEAAKRGTNIVVTDNGTARDYFADTACYCRPDDPESIHAAVMEAWNTAPNPLLAERVSDCSWENAASRVHDIYLEVLDRGRQ